MSIERPEGVKVICRSALKNSHSYQRVGIKQGLIENFSFATICDEGQGRNDIVCPKYFWIRIYNSIFPTQFHELFCSINFQYHLSEFERQEIKLKNLCVMEYECDLKMFLPHSETGRERMSQIFSLLCSWSATYTMGLNFK